MKKLFGTTVIIFLIQFQSLATPVRETRLADPIPAATKTTTEMANLKDLVKTKDPSKTIRSSAGHFWGVIKNIINGDISSKLSRRQKQILKKLMAVEGWVVGDLHNGNVGPVRVGVTADNTVGKVDYTALDFDDPAPKGALAGDFAHHVIAAKAVETPDEADISKQEMFDAYLTGLKGKSYLTPDRIAKLLDMSPEEFRQLETRKAEKFTKPDGLSLIKDGDKSSLISKTEKAEVKQVVNRSIGQYYEVLDVGGREKDSGGSAGALRYLLLIKEKSTGDHFLFELKQEAVSAVSEFEKQPDYTHDDRIDHYVNKNNEKDIRFKSVVIKYSGKNIGMTLRPKPLYFFDYANDGSGSSAYKEFRDLTLFNSFWLGFKQRRDDFENASKLLKIMSEESKEDVYEALKELTQELNHFYEDQSKEFRENEAADKKKKKKKKIKA